MLYDMKKSQFYPKEEHSPPSQSIIWEYVLTEKKKSIIHRDYCNKPGNTEKCQIIAETSRRQ